MVIENGGGREEWDWKIGDRSWQKILSSTLCVCVHGMYRWHNLECALWCVLLVFGLDKVFTLRFFLIDAFPLSSNQNEKGYFPDVSNAKTIKLAAILHNFWGHKYIKFIHFQIYTFSNLYIFKFIHLQFYQFYLNYVGKGGAFHDKRMWNSNFEIGVLGVWWVWIPESFAHQRLSCHPKGSRRCGNWADYFNHRPFQSRNIQTDWTSVIPGKKNITTILLSSLVCE